MTRRAAAVAIVLALIAGFVAGASVRSAATSRPAPLSFVPFPAVPAAEGRTGAPTHAPKGALQAQPRRPAADGHGTPAPSVQPAVTTSPTPVARIASSTPAPTPRGTALHGTASWGYGWSGVVSRLPRGTWICVTGPVGKACGRSVGYGPAVWTHRLVDLDRATFRAVCGPLSIGLCRVSVAGA